jgi:predicted small metal-binding protein
VHVASTKNTKRGDILSKGKMKMMTCPCGWSVKSPFGEDDVLEHSMLHAKKHHPDMAKMKKEDVMKMIKDA